MSADDVVHLTLAFVLHGLRKHSDIDNLLFMVITNISDLVGDWAGFEDLIADLHDTGELVVERNVVLEGKSGANRQIDVLIRHKQGFYEYLVVIECKYLKKRVSRQVVDALASTVDDLCASRGVIFTNEGFQKGAIKQAKHAGIDLFHIRDVAPTVKGKRYRRAIYRVMFYCALGISSRFVNGDGAEVEEAWVIGEFDTKNENQKYGDFQVHETECDLDGEKIGDLLFDAFKALRDKWTDKLDGNHVGDIKFHDIVSIQISHVLKDRSPHQSATHLIFDIGVHVRQNEVLVDILDHLGFVLAVVDVVNNKVHVSKKDRDEISILSLPDESKDQFERVKELRPGMKVEEIEDVFGVDICLGFTSSKGFPEMEIANPLYVRELPNELWSSGDAVGEN